MNPKETAKQAEILINNYESRIKRLMEQNDKLCQQSKELLKEVSLVRGIITDLKMLVGDCKEDSKITKLAYDTEVVPGVKPVCCDFGDVIKVTTPDRVFYRCSECGKDTIQIEKPS